MGYIRGSNRYKERCMWNFGSEEKRSIGRLRRRQEDNIKRDVEEVDFKQSNESK